MDQYFQAISIGADIFIFSIRIDARIIPGALSQRTIAIDQPPGIAAVVGDKDVVILKAISPPSMEDFDTLIVEARQQAKKAGMKRADITTATAKTRGKN